MRRRTALVWSVAISGLTVTAAQPATAYGDGDRDSESVYRLRPALDGAVIVSSLLAVAIPYSLASRLITPTCPCSPESVNAFDRGVIGNANNTADWVSTLTVGLVLVAPPVLDWMTLASQTTLAEDVAVLVEALAVNGALVTGAKYTFQRPIPRVYSEAGAATDRGNYRSFYSGHASTAFAALSVVSITADRRYGWTWEPWMVTGVVGTSIALERIAAGRHFYSDVIVGAVVGAAVGSLVSWVHLRNRGLRVITWLPSGGAGVGLGVAGAI
jgi:membrane-associated phospholipid phosphatase